MMNMHVCVSVSWPNVSIVVLVNSLRPGLDPLRSHCDTLCTSGFVDDVVGHMACHVYSYTARA